MTKNYEQQIQAQAEHYKALAEANYEVRRFRHDFKNMQFAIEKMLDNEQYAEARDVMAQYQQRLNAPESKYDTGNGIADALLTDKQAQAAIYHTELVFQGALPQEVLSPTDLCVILGNTLDNAMEACQKLPPDLEKTISVTCDCNSGFLFLSISNPIAEKVIIHDNHIATTKENKTLHGFGLYSLRSVVEKYDGELKLSSTDDMFTVSIDLCLIASPTTVVL